ncbi:MAG TPA: hypothetical protein PLP23_09010 [Panacibacter sp.]|nr:hypothetical protein [Panacibacter sp.]
MTNNNFRKYIVRPLLCCILSCLFDSCRTQKEILTKPIDGYITFNGVEFIATENEEVQITLTYICHSSDGIISGNVSNRISKELGDIASKNDMEIPTTIFSDSTAQTTIVADNFTQIKSFFDNVSQRFKTITKESLATYQEVSLKADFKHDSIYNKAEFSFSYFIFEPYALISFKAETGNLQIDRTYDSTVLVERTNTDKFVEFIVRPVSPDSSFRKRNGIITVSFNKPPLPWYSWTRIKNFFSDTDTSSNEESKKEQKEKDTYKNHDSTNWDTILSWFNHKLVWTASVLIPILTFFGFQITKKIRK